MRSAALAPPLPDALDERLAPEVVARLAFARELRSTTSLRGDAGVVGPRLPERVEPAHAVPADERVLERASLSACPMCSEPVTLGGGIGHDVDGARVGRRVGRGEDAVLLPEGVPARLDERRVVRLIESGRG